MDEYLNISRVETCLYGHGTNENTRFCFTMEPSAVSIGETCIFDIMISGEDDWIMHNPAGYTAADIPDFDGQVQLEDTDVFYVGFTLGTDAECLCSADSAKAIAVEEITSGWTVSVRCSNEKCILVIVPPPGITKVREIRFVLGNLLCDSAKGDAPVLLYDSTRTEAARVMLTKCPVARIEKFEPVVDTKKEFDIGEAGELAYLATNFDPNDFCAYLNGTEIFPGSKEGKIKINSISSDVYELSFTNHAVRPCTAARETFFYISMIKEFSLDWIHSDGKAAFSWRIDENNADKEYGVSIEHAGSSALLQGTAVEFDVDPDPDKATDFTLTAKTKDCRREYTRTISYSIPCIEKFKEVEENTETVTDCRKKLKLVGTAEGFLNAEELFLHIEDKRLFTGFVFSCKGGGFTTYKHTYEWKIKSENQCKIHIVLESGSTYDATEPEGTWSVSTYNAKEKATIEVTDAYGYQVSKNAG
ncbi:MAG: hypothetical protein Q4C91_06080 [Eubacteriales bacterium]|nr:hypothetical protein [Eubacteriales bacterium]